MLQQILEKTTKNAVKTVIWNTFFQSKEALHLSTSTATVTAHQVIFIKTQIFQIFI